MTISAVLIVFGLIGTFPKFFEQFVSEWWEAALLDGELGRIGLAVASSPGNA